MITPGSKEAFLFDSLAAIERCLGNRKSDDWLLMELVSSHGLSLARDLPEPLRPKLKERLLEIKEKHSIDNLLIDYFATLQLSGQMSSLPSDVKASSVAALKTVAKEPPNDAIVEELIMGLSEGQ